MFPNPGACFLLRSPKRRRQLRHRRTLLGDSETSNKCKFLTIYYNLQSLHFKLLTLRQNVEFLKCLTMNSWHLPGNSFHMSKHPDMVNIENYTTNQVYMVGIARSPVISVGATSCMCRAKCYFQTDCMDPLDDLRFPVGKLMLLEKRYQQHVQGGCSSVQLYTDLIYTPLWGNKKYLRLARYSFSDFPLSLILHHWRHMIVSQYIKPISYISNIVYLSLTIWEEHCSHCASKLII